MLRFGTDGVRGDADADLTTPFVVALGRATARVLGTNALFLVGRDTRLSGTRIERDFVRGLDLEGVASANLGVFPTPAIAYCAQRAGAPAAVVSASHNPWTDNGIKLLAAGGRKLPDDVEAAIEAELAQLVGASLPEDLSAETPAEPADESAAAYVEHLVSALEGRSLAGLRVVLDCANGAAFEVGPRALRTAGADVVVLHAAPDGRNINDQCGSTYPQSLQQAVREHGAALGLALDGDADRVIAVDEQGAIVDGDAVMTAFAIDLRDRGRLRNNAIVVTVMSNLGLRRALETAGIDIVETPVGDRNVLVALEERDLAMGGEQSGHIIFSDLATTGDGLLTGLLLADLVLRTGRPLSTLGAQMTRFPQRLEGVRVAGPVHLDDADALWREVAAVEQEMGERGRVLIRASGTEPLVRVMVEAESESTAAAAVERLCDAVRAAFPSP